MSYNLEIIRSYEFSYGDFFSLRISILWFVIFVMQNEDGSRSTEKKFQKSISMPVTRVRESLNINLVDTSLEQLIKKNGW